MNQAPGAAVKINDTHSLQASYWSVVMNHSKQTDLSITFRARSSYPVGVLQRLPHVDRLYSLWLHSLSYHAACLKCPT